MSRLKSFSYASSTTSFLVPSISGLHRANMHVSHVLLLFLSAVQNTSMQMISMLSAAHAEPVEDVLLLLD